MDAILRDIQQLESVVRDLIELARPGELRREATSVTKVTDDVLEQLSAQLSYRKIVVRREMADALPTVSLDAARFRQRSAAAGSQCSATQRSIPSNS